MGQSPNREHTPEIGDLVPDFALSNQFGESVRLSGLRGGNVVLVFYPFAFSQVCTVELGELAAKTADFETANARVLAISADSKYTLRAYAEMGGLPFDLLSDFWPHGEVASAYGAFDAVQGLARRGTFVIDAEGILRASFFAATAQTRPWHDYERAMTALSASGQR